MGFTKRQRLLEQWRKNMETPAEPDPDFEAFLEQEAKEIDEILACWRPDARPRLADGGERREVVPDSAAQDRRHTGETTVKIKAPPSRIKRLRRCLNPQCTVQIAGGKMPLRSSWVGEYVRIRCTKCGAISVFNPIGKVAADQRRHTYVTSDGGKAVEHIFPKSRVLVA